MTSDEGEPATGSTRAVRGPEELTDLDVPAILAQAEHWLQARPWTSSTLQAGDLGVWTGDEDPPTLV